MVYTTKSGPCALTCWVLAVFVTSVVVLLLRSSTAFLILLPIAAVVTAVAGYVLKALFCKNDSGEMAASASMTSAAVSVPKAATKPAAQNAVQKDDTKATANPAPVAPTADYDGDGKLEGQNEGRKPAMLSAARADGADDLKQIKGVGPKMEKMLNEMGFYHFDQIASWGGDEVAWVDANLKGFKGRVSRDNWVAQAKTLASGGETEFSKRVEDGSVY